MKPTVSSIKIRPIVHPAEIPCKLRLRGPSRWALRVLSLAALGLVMACGSSTVSVPRPRTIVTYSGARIRADHEEMKVVNEWVTREQRNISEDPSFWVISTPVLEEAFPWEGLLVSNDSVTVRVPLGATDGQLVYQIYAHLHLMASMGRQEEWLPEAPDATGYELERAIMARTADAWILGRTVFDTSPFGPLDELAYSKYEGFLDAFIFTARPGEFAVARSEWARANPDEAQRYREWFLEAFNREPPGLRTN
jgi:hypothetical protein